MSKHINFSGIKVSKVFHNKTKQYETLNKMNESTWNDYTKEMINEGVRVKYDAHNDAYIAIPIKENLMPDKKFLLQDDEDGMNLEQDALDLINSIDVTDEEELATEPVAAEPTINLSQFEELLKSYLGNEEIAAPSIETLPTEQTLAPGEFESNVLETEFDVNSDSLSFIEDKIGSENYLATIDPKFSSRNDVEAEDSLEYSDDEDFSSDDYQDYSDEDVEVAPSVSADELVGDAEEEECEECLNEYGQAEYDEYAFHFGDETSPKVTNTSTQTTEPVESEEELELTEDEDFDTEEEVDYQPEEEDEQEPITANGIANVNGQPVQIVLTGVMITPSEVSYVAESAKKNGMKLKAVHGKGKIVNFIIESQGKKVAIKYEDLPKYKTKTPFSINKYTFQTLDEAFEKITLDERKNLLEKKNFKKLMSDDIANRSITDIKESNILKEFQGKISKNYVPGWNVKSVGSINLKNGLNEVYSNITEHSVEKNTLFKTKDGQFYLIKGNLKERSEIGTKRQLVDLQGKKDFGTGEVVGVYENSIKGLGQIMYKVKRTSLPLLSWK